MSDDAIEMQGVMIRAGELCKNKRHERTTHNTKINKNGTKRCRDCRWEYKRGVALLEAARRIER